MATIPVDGAFEAFIEGHFGLETEEVFGAGHVETSAGLSVWFGCVPANLAIEAEWIATPPVLRCGLFESYNLANPSADGHKKHAATICAAAWLAACARSPL